MKKCIILFLTCVAFGCSKSNDPKTSGTDSFLKQLEIAPYVNVSKENLPEWFVARINDYYETRPLKIQIYKGEWNKQAVYFIMDPHSSCLCDFYTEDGERLSNDPSMNIHLTSKNWILIYECGGELFSN